MNTFTTYLSSLLGVIAEYNSNHAQKWGQICWKSVQLDRVAFFRIDFFQNWYFSGPSHQKLNSSIYSLVLGNAMYSINHFRLRWLLYFQEQLYSKICIRNWNWNVNKKYKVLKNLVLYIYQVLCIQGVIVSYLQALHVHNHGLRTPNEGINQRNLKIWADVADKICFGRT